MEALAARIPAAADLDRLEQAAHRALSAIAGRWALAAPEHRQLAAEGIEPPERLARASHLLGIYRAAQHLFGRDDHAVQGWLREPNTGAEFGGEAPLALILRAPADGLAAIRLHLEAQFVA